MLPTDENAYLLGTQDDETRRLGFQHRVWAKYAFDIWERAGFGPGQTIVDLGCGPGFAAIDLADIVGPKGKVIAIDESKRFIAQLDAKREFLGLDQIDAHVADAQKPDLPPSGIDGAFARWVLCFVSDPESVVAQVAKALKPGGALAVMDYYNYSAFTFAPRSPALDRVARAVIESWKHHDGDLDVMLQVPVFMNRAGLDVVDVRPVIRIARPGTALWEWPATFFRTYLTVLENGGFLSKQERESFQQDWSRRSADPRSILSTPPMLEVIGRKPVR